MASWVSSWKRKGQPVCSPWRGPQKPQPRYPSHVLVRVCYMASPKGNHREKRVYQLANWFCYLSFLGHHDQGMRLDPELTATPGCSPESLTACDMKRRYIDKESFTLLMGWAVQCTGQPRDLRLTLWLKIWLSSRGPLPVSTSVTWITFPELLLGSHWDSTYVKYQHI